MKDRLAARRQKDSMWESVFVGISIRSSGFSIATNTQPTMIRIAPIIPAMVGIPTRVGSAKGNVQYWFKSATLRDKHQDAPQDKVPSKLCKDCFCPVASGVIHSVVVDHSKETANADVDYTKKG